MDAITGQALLSQTHTPNRPALASEWDGRDLNDHAAQLSWSHATPRADWYLQGQDLGPDFRADDGFIPQVGYREIFADAGYTVRPKKAFLSRVRFFTTNYVDADLYNHRLNQHLSVGTGMDGLWNSFARLELNRDVILVGAEQLQRFRPRLQIQASPGRVINSITLDSYFGEEIDFDNARRGKGATLLWTVSVRPNDHLELRGNANQRWLNVDVAGQNKRLFTAQVERLRATWAFSSRSFLRLIGQYVQTDSDPTLYGFAVNWKEVDFSGSALLAYKLNWQTVVYAGYGDQRTFNDPSNKLVPAGRQVFAKLSYAWQQ